jgi:hypothetical protein
MLNNQRSYSQQYAGSKTKNPVSDGVGEKTDPGIKRYIKSMAFTKAVVWKGRIRVSHSQWVAIAKINAALDARNTNHQRPLYFFACSILLFFYEPGF